MLTVAVLLFSPWILCSADTAEFHKTLSVSNAESVKLSLDIQDGEVEVAYSRDGEVAVSAFAQSSAQNKIDEAYFRMSLSIEQVGNRITIQQTPNFVYREGELRLRYRVDVPYRTEVTSSVKHGTQRVRGVTGPVDLRGNGDASVAYVSQSATVELERGSVDLQMVGDHVSAHTGAGNITAERLPKGIRAETADGDIKLMVVGASEAIVRSGSGRIEVGGARDTLSANTESGDLRVQAVPHADWTLRSNSGSIRLELPPHASFDLDASTASGKLQFERDDLPAIAPDTLSFSQKVNGGARKVAAHTEKGTIWIH